MGSKLTLYHAPPSYYSMIARLALAEKGVDYDSVWIDIHLQRQQHSLAYAKINPKLTVPSMTTSDAKALTSSVDILNFVDSQVVADITFARGGNSECLLEALLAQPIEELTMATFFCKRPRLLPKAQRTLEKAIRQCEVLASKHPAYQSIFEAKIVKNQRRLDAFSTEMIKQTLADATQKVNAMLADIEQSLGEGPFLCGEQYGLADVVATVFLARLVFIGREQKLHETTLVADYFQRLKQRPSFKQADIWLHVQKSYPLRLILKFIRDRLFASPFN